MATVKAGERDASGRLIVWVPQPKQVAFMRRPEYEGVYGGAAGGGKTHALLMEALRQTNIRHYKGLLLRKTYPELEEMMSQALDYYPRIIPGAKFNAGNHVWRFPSGARIYFGSMQHGVDKTKYQGRQFDFIGVDEMTHFLFGEVSYLFSRNRPNGPGTRVYFRGTCNPGGVGHAWVRDRYIAGKTPLQTYKYRFMVEGKEYERTRVFVPATVFDNRVLLENEPNYIGNLSLLPEAERRALLYGDWDAFAGQAFPEWRNNSKGHITREWTHVIRPFDIPMEWRIYRSFDFGYAKPFSVAWWAVDHDGVLYRIRELYGCTTTPNTGTKWTPAKIAEEVKTIDEKYYKGRTIIGIADPSIWDASRGESIAQMMERHGIYWQRGDNKRIPGKAQVHYRLAFDRNGIPGVYVFDTCKAIIRTMPTLIYDDKDLEDVDSDGEDHAYDEFRYLCMERPIGARVNHTPKPKPFDPLESEPIRIIGGGFMGA